MHILLCWDICKCCRTVVVLKLCGGDIFATRCDIVHSLSCGDFLLCRQFSMLILSYWYIYNFGWINELLGLPYRTINITIWNCMRALSSWILLSWSWDTMHILLCWDICKYRRTNVV